MSATASAGPENTASTEPSRRLRTQPDKAASERGVLGPGAVTHALDATANDDVADGVAHPNSPLSLGRAPRSRDGDQRRSEQM